MGSRMFGVMHLDREAESQWPEVSSFSDQFGFASPAFDIGMVARLLVKFGEQKGHELDIASQILDLQKRVRGLEARALNAQIELFDPEVGLTVSRPIPVSFRNEGTGVVATFFDGGISTSGETSQDAFDALKDLIVHTYRVLASLPPEKLGIGPKRKLAVLRGYIRNEND